MRGSSGAVLLQQGDFVTKVSDATDREVAWLTQAQAIGFVDGVERVGLRDVGVGRYTMRHIVGHLATHEPTTAVVTRLYGQTKEWAKVAATSNATWHSYIKRLHEHAIIADSSIITGAVQLLANSKPLPSTFCHGDLTLENVIIGFDGVAVLIDPNYSTDLFQSWLLDCGKLLQSTHTDYHAIFDSNASVCLAQQDKALCELLIADGIYIDSLVACLSHIIRLAKYKRTEIDAVETLAMRLIGELECLS